MTTHQDVQRWRGMKMVRAGGDKIGIIEEILLDPPDRRARLGGSEDPPAVPP